MKARHFLFAIFAAVLTLAITSGEPAAAETVSLASVAGFAAGDALLKKTKALPTGASAITSDGIDLGHGSYGSNVTEHELLIEAPAVNTTQLPNAQTLTYAIVTSANSDMSSPTVVNSSVLVQTGADSAGAAAATARYRLPTDCQRYVAVKCTKSGAGDASAASVALSLKF